MARPTNKISSEEVLEALASDKKYQELHDLSSKVTTYTEVAEEAALRLTPKQRAFLEQYAMTNDIAKALTQANLGTHPTSVQRYRNCLKTPDARLYMERIKSLGLVRSVLSIDEVIEKARKIFDLGCERDDLKAAMQAVSFLGSFKGMTPESRKNASTLSPEASQSHLSGDKPMEVKDDISRFQSLLSKTSSPSAVREQGERLSKPN